MAKVQYENGNIHSPVVVLGDDPTTEGNVLVSRLATAVSVPSVTITSEEGTPVDDQGNPLHGSSVPASDLDKDAEIARLKQQLAATQGNNEGD